MEGARKPDSAAVHTGRVNPKSGTQLYSFCSRVQMLFLATESRRCFSARIPLCLGPLPVFSLTAWTLWARAMHFMITYTPQEHITSAVPILKYTSRQIKRTKGACLVMELSRSRDSILQAVGMYKDRAHREPLRSNIPWVLLARCHEFNVQSAEVDALARLIQAIHGPVNSLQELLLCAYLRLGWEKQLRECVMRICVESQSLSTLILAQILAELQGTVADRRLACRLWSTQINIPGFAPSQTCVRLAVKAALHADSVGLAMQTYQSVLQQQWPGVRSGYWLDKLLVYGLALNGRVLEAFELTDATADTSDGPAALQTAHKYELLLRALSRTRRADDAVSVFEHACKTMRPTLGMYSSVAGVLASECGWKEAEKCLKQMYDNGFMVPDNVWKRVLLGVARRGHIDSCDHILAVMAANNIACSYIVVQAAVDAYAQLGDVAMLARWTGVVVAALHAHAQLPKTRQRHISIDGKPAYTSSAVQPAFAESLTLARPELFTDDFVARNELVWHRAVLTSLLNAVGQHGTAQQVMRLWETLCEFRTRVSTLRFSPQMYMALARALAWHDLLARYEPLILAWMRDAANGFSFSQKYEIELFVRSCIRGDRSVLKPPRTRAQPHEMELSDFVKDTGLQDHNSAQDCNATLK
ncbi:hypothetical protein GGH96_004313 [Coemansia sp. RSA 1972]|nr:hypothetical protein GGH96_004313 [Coemansia sp. RSA 1972]